ncbi:MAG: D-alanyl-D-alanine carboxypeptidase [Tissierellia bacterium]|nr:D-alanyl-D-alanine carboxypeptidase [Tissierellia bacterium]MDD4726172.1 D-alanyl-D-alanine carboxypeptidase [Tissierellia bacterium]
MKRRILILILILVLFINGNTNATGLNLSAESYILIEENSGRIIYENKAHKKLPMASTTKIMTGLLAIEYGNLDDIVVIGEESIDIEGSSIYLKEGERIKLIDLIYGLILRSGNDSAVAIANHVGNTEENFISIMNDKAKIIGALNTNFVNTHGLYDANHYTTAYDLAIITREALKYKEFEEIFSAKSYKCDRVTDNYFVNKNKALWDYEGADGGKTGYTMASGRCLVSSATRDNMRLIAVSLNAPDWFNDNYKLMEYGFENLKLYNIYEKGQLITLANVRDGTREKVALVSGKDLIYPLRDDEIKDIKMSVHLDKKIKAPILENDVLGYIEVFLNGSLIRRDNLIAKYEVETVSFLNRILQTILNKVE